MDPTTYALFGAVTLLVAVAAIRAAVATGTPSLLLYLAIGVALGEAGAREIIDFEAVAWVGYFCLALILAEGGLTTRWHDVRGSVAPAAVLATVGTVVSTVCTAAVAHWVLGWSWMTALIVSAVVSSTDAAAVFSVLRSVPLPRRVVGLLEAESGFNDAPVVIMVGVLVSLHDTPNAGPAVWFAATGVAAVELAGGVLWGLAVGWGAAKLLNRLALPASGLYPLAVIAVCLVAYTAGEVMMISGFLATYVAALFLGNARLPHREPVRSFAESVGWLAQIVLFVVLGMEVDFTTLVDQVPVALVVGGALFVVGRPVSVLLSLTWFGMTWREQVVLSWAGMRGAIPIVLATIPLLAGTPGTEELYSVVFVLVVLFTLVQAPTLPWVVRRLRLPGEPTRPMSVESTHLGALDAELVEVTVGQSSKLAGLTIRELRLPPGAKVTLVVRDGQSWVPSETSRLRPRDVFIMVVTQADYSAAVRRVEEVSAGGRLARWLHPRIISTRNE